LPKLSAQSFGGFKGLKVLVKLRFVFKSKYLIFVFLKIKRPREDFHSACL